jgi:hypothetical protein
VIKSSVLRAVVTTILALYFQNLWLGTAHRKLSLIISLSFDFIKASCFASYLHMLYVRQFSSLSVCVFQICLVSFSFLNHCWLNWFLVFRMIKICMHALSNLQLDRWFDQRTACLVPAEGWRHSSYLHLHVVSGRRMAISVDLGMAQLILKVSKITRLFRISVKTDLLEINRIKRFSQFVR